MSIIAADHVTGEHRLGAMPPGVARVACLPPLNHLYFKRAETQFADVT
jgi:hypothetical protein